MAIAATYPRVRITFSCSCGAATAAPALMSHPGAGSALHWRPLRPPPDSLPACSRPSFLAAVLGNGDR
jgi:hypothetical protein